MNLERLILSIITKKTLTEINNDYCLKPNPIDITTTETSFYYYKLLANNDEIKFEKDALEKLKQIGIFMYENIFIVSLKEDEYNNFIKNEYDGELYTDIKDSIIKNRILSSYL